MNKLITTTIGTGLNVLSHFAPEKTGEIGFNLFCYPLRPALKQKHISYLESARLDRFHLRGEDIQVYRWGSGKRKVFFAHGWQSHTYRWKPYISHLDPGEFTVYAVDAPGHGMSSGKALTVPFYGEVIERLSQDVGKWDVMVGHSIGGFTLMYALSGHTEINTGKLVLLAPPSGAGEFVSYYGNQLGLSDRALRLTVDHFTSRLKNPPEYYKATSFAAYLDMPGLIIHDEGDEDTSVINARRIHERWSESELVITNGLGHNLRSMDIVNRVVDYIG